MPTPLSPEVIQTLAVAAESDPALKLLIALIGIHALYPHQARELPLAAIDFTGGRLLHGDIDHPLDAFTHQAAADYIQLRHSRWPHTRNPHLFLSSQTAHSRTPVTIGWMQLLLKDLPVTAQRLREDRISKRPPSPAPTRSTCARYSTSPRHRTALHPDVPPRPLVRPRPGGQAVTGNRPACVSATESPLRPG
ncbi:hypothetical protein NKH18_02420 [Streptomyces sp. M10(2022)]